jgi:hypothetical protein
MEIEWDEKLELPVVGCPVCKRNRLENDERYPPYELLMHLKVGHTKGETLQI